MTKTRFSVLMSIYKKESPGYFDLSLESLYVQRSDIGEVVLVKDGPLTEDLDDLIGKWHKRFDDKLKLVELKANVGLSKALNQGLKQCRFDWVARMDTDDVCKPERLALQAEFIEKNPNVDVLGSYAITIDETGAEKKLLKVPLGHNRIKKFVWSCPMIHPTVCFRKDKILALGGYNPEAGPRQDDYDLWFRCAAAGYVFANIPKPLLLYRFTDDQIRKNTLKVGYYRLRVGFKGNRMLKAGPVAYLGVMVPFVRAMLPYPLNVWFYKLLSKVNPRNR